MENELENKERPTVVHAINNLDVGGVETMALETIRHFEEWGENHLVVVDGRRQPRRPAFDDLGIPISVWDHRPGQYGRLVRKAYRYFQAVDADAFVCWSYGNHAFVGLGALLAGVFPGIVHVGNAPPGQGKDRWKWGILGWLGLLSMRYLVACSQYVQNELSSKLGLPRSKIAVAYNGCDVETVNRKATSCSGTAHPVVGMVARLNQIKDHPTLIRAFSHVLEKHPRAELWIVGDGTRRKELEKKTRGLGLQKNVRFLGNRSDVPELLGQMGVFAFATTEAEGFGIVLAEALAAEVPVVATDVGPCAEVLRDGAWGELVPPENSEALADGILQALNGDIQTPDLRDVYDRYDTLSAAERYWSLLFDGLEKPGM